MVRRGGEGDVSGGQRGESAGARGGRRGRRVDASRRWSRHLGGGDEVADGHAGGRGGAAAIGGGDLAMVDGISMGESTRASGRERRLFRLASRAFPGIALGGGWRRAEPDARGRGSARAREALVAAGDDVEARAEGVIVLVVTRASRRGGFAPAEGLEGARGESDETMEGGARSRDRGGRDRARAPGKAREHALDAGDVSWNGRRDDGRGFPDRRTGSALRGVAREPRLGLPVEPVHRLNVRNPGTPPSTRSSTSGPDVAPPAARTSPPGARRDGPRPSRRGFRRASTDARAQWRSPPRVSPRSFREKGCPVNDDS